MRRLLLLLMIMMMMMMIMTMTMAVVSPPVSCKMHVLGIGTRRSCSEAVRLFKRVAQSAPGCVRHPRPRGAVPAQPRLPHSSDHDRTRTARWFAATAGLPEVALLHYLQLAEKGYEIAQSSAAWLLDTRAVSPAMFDPPPASTAAAAAEAAAEAEAGAEQWSVEVELAGSRTAAYRHVPPVPTERAEMLQHRAMLRLYERAALQKHPHSLLRVGDLHYFGHSLAATSGGGCSSATAGVGQTAVAALRCSPLTPAPAVLQPTPAPA